MQSGSYYGAISLLEGMIRRFREQLGVEAPWVATGGFSRLLAEEGIFDRHEPYLSLKGLAIIGRMKHESQK